MEQLLVVTGPPGAGKSAVAGMLAQSAEPSALVEGDAFFGFLGIGRIDPWLPESHQQNGVVMSAVGAAIGRFVSNGYFTVLDGVVGLWFLDDVLRAAGLRSADDVILLPDVEVCVERVTARSDNRFADDSATRQMHHDFAASVVEERFTLRRPVGDPVQVAAKIDAARVRGLLRYESEL